MQGVLKTLYRIASALVLVFIAGLLAGLLPGLTTVNAWIEEHEPRLLLLTGGMAAAGVLLLIASVLLPLVVGRAPPAGPDAFSFAHLKAAFARGALLRSPVWRRRLGAACGAILIFFGVCGLAIVAAPMPVKLIVAFAAGYAIARTAWGLVRA